MIIYVNEIPVKCYVFEYLFDRIFLQVDSDSKKHFSLYNENMKKKNNVFNVLNDSMQYKNCQIVTLKNYSNKIELTCVYDFKIFHETIDKFPKINFSDYKRLF